MVNLTQRRTQSGPFLGKSGYFFQLSKKERGRLPLLSPSPSCAPAFYKKTAGWLHLLAKDRTNSQAVDYRSP